MGPTVEPGMSANRTPITGSVEQPRVVEYRHVHYRYAVIDGVEYELAPRYVRRIAVGDPTAGPPPTDD